VADFGRRSGGIELTSSKASWVEEILSVGAIGSADTGLFAVDAVDRCKPMARAPLSEHGESADGIGAA